jgi:hypothetical protein
MPRSLCPVLAALGCVLAVGAVAAPTTVSAAPALLSAASAPTPAPASLRAIRESPNSILGAACGIAGKIPGAIGRTCKGISIGGKVIGGVGTLLGSLFGGGGGGGGGGSGGGSFTKAALVAAGLAAAGLWAAHGAQAALRELAHVIGSVTSPDLTSGWFSADYLKIEAIATVLTLPFLIAAVIHALVRSEPSLLAKAAFGYVPACFLAVNVAAPWTMMLLKLTDQMSGVVSTAGGDGGGRFLGVLGGATVGLSSFGGSTFLGLLLGIVIVGAAVALTLEMLAREAAVYIIVLMLPLTFAAMVWPARRIWAIRAIEVLVALILSKFVIVSMLTLSQSALAPLGTDGVGTVLSGMTLLILAAFSPWVLLKLIPFTEVAASIGGALQQHRERFRNYAETANAIDTMRVAADSSSAGEPHLPEPQPGEGEPMEPPADHRLPAGGSGRDGGLPPGGPGRNGGLPPGGSRPNGELPPGGSGPNGGFPPAGVPDLVAPGDGGRPGIGAVVARDDPQNQAAPSPMPSLEAPATTTLAADGDGEPGGGRGPEGAPLAAEPPPAPSRVRSPGMDAPWQAPNLTWRPVTLGPDDDWQNLAPDTEPPQGASVDPELRPDPQPADDGSL